MSNQLSESYTNWSLQLQNMARGSKVRVWKPYTVEQINCIILKAKAKVQPTKNSFAGLLLS